MVAKKRTLDFSNVKERSNINPLRQAEGDYFARIESVEEYVTKDESNPKEMWLFLISTPEDNGRASYPYYCGFGEKELFKVRNLFLAAGIKVPQKAATIDPNKVVGKNIGIALIDDEYEGKAKSVIDVVFPAADLPESSGDPREDDDEEEVEEDELDLDDTEEEDEEEELEEEDDEEEEEPEPVVVKKKATKKAAAPAKKAAVRKKKAAVVEDDDEDLEELELEDL